MNARALSLPCASALAVSLGLALGAQQPGAAAPLVPAGTINAVHARHPTVVLTEDDRAVVRFVTAIRDRFLKGAEILAGRESANADLRGKDVVAYVTPEHPWFAAHRKALPFRFERGAVVLEGRRFEGTHLRVIAALRNPDDAERRVLVYAAARAADLVEINAMFHGPTEWLVADGRNVLGSGSFAGGVLGVDAMRADFDELVATVAAVHPAAVDGLPKDVAAAAAAARAAIDPQLDRAAFATLCASVLLALHDAHSAVALPRSGETLALPLVWLPSGLFVDADAGALRTGDRVVALAGRTPQELLARLAQHVPAENEHWLRHQAPFLLADRGVLRLLGLAPAAPVTVRVARGERELDVSVPAGPLPRRPARGEWVRYEIDEKRSLGVFTLDRCVVDATYGETLDAFFTAVHEAKIRRIAVDLRANSGGNSMVVDEFLRYLDVGEYASFSGDVRWSAAALQQRKAPGEPRFEPARPMRKKNVRRSDPPPFAGELFVLTGPATFSSGNWFAVVVRDNGLGTIVGEPTGNAPSSYGDVLTFALPRTGVDYTLSFKRWVRPDPTRDPATTLEPDVLVPRTAATLQDGSDPVLDWLRAR